MKTLEISLAKIGNSRGIRLSADLIRKHGLESGIVLEDRGHEIAIKPKAVPKKLSWEETYKEMAAANEDWSDWDCTVADGLDDIPWEHPIPEKVRKWAEASAAKERRAKADGPGRTWEG